MKTKIACFYALFASLFSITYAQSGVRRPQTPQPPFPYRAGEVVFFNEADSARLSGTLTCPDKKGKFPAVVLISGSGTQNRDEEILGHKPFLVIADHLTRNGIAVLRFDDRGAGGSSRGRGSITTRSNARDVKAAVDFLKTRKEIDGKKIGLIGHSEGGTIVFIVAAEDKEIRFVVSLAGAGVSGDKILLSQQEQQFRASGAPDSVVQNLLEANREYFNLIKASEANNGDFRADVSRWLKKKYPAITGKQMEAQLKRLLDPWMYDFVKEDPYNTIKQVTVPVLAVNGKKDMQVRSDINLSAIEQALREGGNVSYRIEEPEELNHLFQHAKTGAPAEYGQLEETFAPEVLDILTSWILKQCR